QCDSNLRNCCIQRLVEINKGVFRPYPLPQLFASDQLARVFQQNGTDLKGLARQCHPHSIFVQLTSLQVRFKDSETNNLRRTVAIVHVQPQTVVSNSSTSDQLLQPGPVKVVVLTTY